uniref:Uncharacterized protein n=1 Tax=Triticum urartu TaxID=4572 RepID=A0A8R7URJ7_TRIUA
MAWRPRTARTHASLSVGDAGGRELAPAGGLWPGTAGSGGPLLAGSGVWRPEARRWFGQRLSAAGLRGGSLTGWWSTVAWSG